MCFIHLSSETCLTSVIKTETLTSGCWTKLKLWTWEIIKNRNWTWAGHITRRTDNSWSAALTVWTPMGGKRNREMNYNSTGTMWTGTLEQETETFGSNMLRLSSCSGLIMAEDDVLLMYKNVLMPLIIQFYLENKREMYGFNGVLELFPSP